MRSQQNLYLINKSNGQSFAYSKRPVTLLAFKHKKHAAIVQKQISTFDYDIQYKPPQQYLITAIKPLQSSPTEIASTSELYISLICKLNNVKVSLVTDIDILTNKAMFLLTEEVNLKNVYTDERMVRGNLEKIFRDDSNH